MTSLLEDPIAQLRAERPDATSDLRLDAMSMPDIDLTRTLTPSACPAPRLRHLRRLAVVAACALAAVLSGVQVLTRTSSESRHRLTGISPADAKELARTALTAAPRLTDFDSTVSYTSVERGGSGRTDSRVYRTIAIGGDRSETVNVRNDFLDRDTQGLETLTVAGMPYHEKATDEDGTHWILDASQIGARQYHSAFTLPGQKPLDFDEFIEQLDREDLIEARRTSDGSLVVELAQPARELAPVDGAIVTNVDPITMFAWGMSHGRTQPIVHVRITVSDDGALKDVRAWADIVTTFANGHNRGIQLPARVTQRLSWKPVGDRTLKAPDPSDVRVVGKWELARIGLKGPVGPHGKLDEYTKAELNALQVAAIHSRQYRPRRTANPARPARHYPALFARKRAEQLRFKQLIEVYRPFDRAQLAANPSCTPFWPASGRAMDRTTALQGPDKAGWSCTMPNGAGSFSLAPDSDNYQAHPGQSGGITITSTS
ncbi:MAG: hypothetical protein H7287_11745 [Thermoleophilia bacterium]|nr:hypothetical protein [Thermoleophilia bacterium]